MKKKISTLSLFVFICLMGCGDTGQVNETVDYNSSEEVYETSEKEVATVENISEVKAPAKHPKQQLIKHGQIRFSTQNLEESRTFIQRAVTKYNGYIVEDELNEYGRQQGYHLMIRVPVQYFDSLAAIITAHPEKVEELSIRQEDVSEEFIGLEARIKTQESLIRRYEQLLTRANTIAEMLEIEQALSVLHTQIELVKGRHKHLKSQVKYSTLVVDFHLGYTASGSFGTEVKTAVKRGWQGFLWVLIGLSYLWPIVLPVTGLIVWAIWKDRQSSRSRKPPVLQKED